MDWVAVIKNLSDVEAAWCVALAAALAVFWWYMRLRRREHEELKADREMNPYQHRFESEPVLKQMQRERERLFRQHRTPTGVREARATRVAEARERLHDEEFFQQES
jgi:hypothetical protein